MGNIVDGQLVFDALKYLPRDHDEFPELLLEPGDVLFNRTNSPELVGKTAVYTGRQPSPCSFASYLIRLRLRAYEPMLLAAYLNSGYGRAWIRSCVSQQVGQANVSGGKLKALELPVPPRNEQRRIVAKLEALQSRSRRAREALDAVPPLLEKLRQSILAAAFRGDLTADWRAQNPNTEPASVLLARIRTERRKKWEEAELAKLKAKGKPPTDDKWKAKYEEPERVVAAGLPELPAGWCWASVEELASDEPRSIQSGPFGSSLLHSEFCAEGVLAIGIDNVRDGTFSMGTEHRISEAKYEDLRKYTARPGDVLVTVMATVGRCCTVPDDLEPAIITKHVYRVSPDRRLVVPDYLMHSMRGAPALRDAMKADLRGQTRPGINGEIIRALPVPLAPLAEQRFVLAALQRALDSERGMTALIGESARRLGELDSSVLARAFRGELVPQDPNEEPADITLSRAAGTSAEAPRQRARRPKAAE